MTTAMDPFATHEVVNQPHPSWPYNMWTSDPALQHAVADNGGQWGADRLAALGSVAGGEMIDLGFEANESRPRFQPFDRYGHRIDEVRFHPSYHRLMASGVEHGVAGFAWRHEETPGAHVVRAALMYLHGQADQGTCCPLTMTYASMAALRHAPDLAASWAARIVSTEYDPRSIPAWDKRGNTIGMGMTEKQGGSDVRANTTRATRCAGGGDVAGGNGDLYRLIGHKWFFSAPMSDAFLITARTDAGPTCFLVPRFAPDGCRNGLHLMRLKDKLGDWSNASSEVEITGALGWRVGDEGRGIATILGMVSLTRQDCIIGSAAIMRQALVQAIHHARSRMAFGRRLVEQPLMKNVLADLALESEASMRLALRVARAVDASPRSSKEAAFARIATAIGKYWVCKRCVAFVNEAQECLGGAGYVEESMLPRLYRQAPLNSIWEGSGNIQCLDVLRAVRREPATREALARELASARGLDSRFDRHADGVLGSLGRAADGNLDEADARRLVEDVALALQAAQMLRAGGDGGDGGGRGSCVGSAGACAAGEDFCSARLDDSRGRAFGTLSDARNSDSLIARALLA